MKIKNWDPKSIHGSIFLFYTTNYHALKWEHLFKTLFYRKKIVEKTDTEMTLNYDVT